MNATLSNGLLCSVVRRVDALALHLLLSHCGIGDLAAGQVVGTFRRKSDICLAVNTIPLRRSSRTSSKKDLDVDIGSSRNCHQLIVFSIIICCLCLAQLRGYVVVEA